MGILIFQHIVFGCMYRLVNKLYFCFCNLIHIGLVDLKCLLHSLFLVLQSWKKFSGYHCELLMDYVIISLVVDS